MKFSHLPLVWLLGLTPVAVQAQRSDTVLDYSESITSFHNPDTTTTTKGSNLRKKHDPHEATIYSAVLPGAGQIYNKKYWKVPIVYTAIGIPAYFYFYNKKWYQDCQYALAVTVNGGNLDSFKKVSPDLKPFVLRGDVTSIINTRNEARKNQDYSALFFLLFWGLNIVDATVDAHLRDFNVNNNLSIRFKPLFCPGPAVVAGMSMVFDIHKSRFKFNSQVN